jgi:hypothetical protein
VQDLKRVAKAMEYLQDNIIQGLTHLWKPDEWSTTTIKFYTKLFLVHISCEHATKLVNNLFNKQKKGKEQVPIYWMKMTPIKTMSPKGKVTTKVFGLEVSVLDTRAGSNFILKLVRLSFFQIR